MEADRRPKMYSQRVRKRIRIGLLSNVAGSWIDLALLLKEKQVPSLRYVEAQSFAGLKWTFR